MSTLEEFWARLGCKGEARVAEARVHAALDRHAIIDKSRGRRRWKHGIALGAAPLQYPRHQRRSKEPGSEEAVWGMLVILISNDVERLCTFDCRYLTLSIEDGESSWRGIKSAFA